MKQELEKETLKQELYTKAEMIKIVRETQSEIISTIDKRIKELRSDIFPSEGKMTNADDYYENIVFRRMIEELESLKKEVEQ
jgi:hypothetical protein